MFLDLVGISKAIFDSTMMDDTLIVQTFVDDWDVCTQRELMLAGKAYYRADNAVKSRIQTKYVNGTVTLDADKVNIRVAHPYMKMTVDEKCSYLLGTAPTYSSEDGAFKDAIQEVLDESFSDLLIDVGTESSNTGIGWLHPYLASIDGVTQLEFINVPSEQVIPLWADEQHTRLDGVIRHYYVTEYQGMSPVLIQKVELWTPTTVQYFERYGGSLVLDIERNPLGNPIGHFETPDGAMYGWGHVPFVPFKNNSQELPDLVFVKDIIDEYDGTVSDMSNTLKEVQQLIFVLRNYGGTSLEQFMADLRYYRAITVDDDGGVETLSADINPTAAEAHLERLKQDFYQFSQSVDLSKDSLGSNPSGVALDFMYSGLKLKADAMERKFKAGFRELFWFVAKSCEVLGTGKYDPKTADVTFTRTVIQNTAEAIKGVTDATATHSLRTSLEHSPWVDDVHAELLRIEEEGTTQAAIQPFAERSNVPPTPDPMGDQSQGSGEAAGSSGDAIHAIDAAV